MRKEIIAKREVPPMPEEIRIQYANREFNTGEDTEIRDLSGAGIRDLVEKVRSGVYQSLYLTPNEDGELDDGFFQLESAGGGGLIFFQIVDTEEKTSWGSYDPEYLDSLEESPIEPSDGQTVFPMKYTMQDRELAAKCVEWYAHTLEPYPGMEWLKETW